MKIDVMKLESKIGKFYVITPSGERIGPPKTPEEIQLLTKIYFPEPGTRLEESETGVMLTWEEFAAEFLIDGIKVNPPKSGVKHFLFQAAKAFWAIFLLMTLPLSCLFVYLSSFEFGYVFVLFGHLGLLALLVFPIRWKRSR